MTTKIVNIDAFMECPICGRKSLQLQNLQFSPDESQNMASFKCSRCNFNIYDEGRDSNDLVNRLSGEPLDFFKNEIEKRGKTMAYLIIDAKTAKQITIIKQQELMDEYKQRSEFKDIMLAIEAASRRGESAVSFKHRSIFKDGYDRIACNLILKELGYETDDGLMYNIYW